MEHYADGRKTKQYIEIAEDWDTNNWDKHFMPMTKAFLQGANYDYFDIRMLNLLCSGESEKKGKLLDLIHHIHDEIEEQTLFR